MNEEENISNGGSKKKLIAGESQVTGKMKVISLILGIVIIISSIAGIIYFKNNQTSDNFHVWALGGIDGGNSNIKGEITISEEPILNEELTINWNYKYTANGTIVPTEYLSVIQIILPESLSLISDNERFVSNPDDPFNFTWKIIPIQVGDFYIKFGSNYEFEGTEYQNESLNYDVVGKYPSTYIVGVRVGTTSGQILSPDETVEEEYAISGFKSIIREDTPLPSYVFQSGDTVWLDVTYKPLVDLPNVKLTVSVPPSVDPSNYISLINYDFEETVNLTRGIDNVFNYSFTILQDFPTNYSKIRIGFQSSGSVVLIGGDGSRVLDGSSNHISIYIQTNNTSRSGTRSGDTRPLEYTVFPDSCLITGDISGDIEWSQLEKGSPKINLTISLELVNDISEDLITVKVKTGRPDYVKLSSSIFNWNTQNSQFSTTLTVTPCISLNDSTLSLSTYSKNDSKIMDKYMFLSVSGEYCWINETAKTPPAEISIKPTNWKPSVD